MSRVFPLLNEIRHYEWGSTKWIPELLGLPNTEKKPCAELWMGANYAAPSKLEAAGALVGLDAFIAADAEAALGPACIEGYGEKLPFLLKALAAEHPLSLQAHPSRDQARSGYEAEDAAGVPLKAPQRNYKDRNHKPELMCALTDFRALCGFRTPDRIEELFRELAAPVLALPDAGRGNGVLAEILERLLRMDKDSGARLAAFAARKAQEVLAAGTPNASAWETVAMLCAEYPQDPTVLAPLLLNVIDLKPGDAIFLPAGILHGYMRGFGIEIMADSDNVLRGGLTAKHVDVAELGRTLRFEPFSPQILRPQGAARALKTYRTAPTDFELSVVSLNGENVRLSPGRPYMAICTEGDAMLEDGEGGKAKLARGGSAFAAADAKALSISGTGRVFVASIPENGKIRA